MRRRCQGARPLNHVTSWKQRLVTDSMFTPPEIFRLFMSQLVFHCPPVCPAFSLRPTFKNSSSGPPPLSIYSCLRSLRHLHQSAAVPPAGTHPSCRSPPHVSVCQHLRGKISPSASHPSLRIFIQIHQLFLHLRVLRRCFSSSLLPRRVVFLGCFLLRLFVRNFKYFKTEKHISNLPSEAASG